MISPRHTRPRLLVLAASCLVGVLLLASSALASIAPRSAGIEAGNLSEFDQVNMATGSVTPTSAQADSGSYSAKAVYSGGGANGYARGLYEVSWAPGEEVIYSASFYLPVGFKDAMQGQVSLMRWDNWPSYGSDADNGGIALWGSDHRARLFRSNYGDPQDVLVGPFELPEGRWFTLSVRQRFSTTSPYSEVRLDGQLIGSSTAPNYYGRTIDRVRYGIVAIGAGNQLNPLTLFFDDAAVTTAETAPVPPPPVNAAPTIEILSPSNEQLIGKSLDARARAADDKAVSKVIFSLDGKAYYTDTAAPYVWNPSRRWLKRKLGAGRHILGVGALDAQGLSAGDWAGFRL